MSDTSPTIHGIPPSGPEYKNEHTRADTPDFRATLPNENGDIWESSSDEAPNVYEAVFLPPGIAYICSECLTEFPVAAADGAPFVCFYCKDRTQCRCVPCRQCTRNVVHRNLATAPYCSVLCAQHAIRIRCEAAEEDAQTLREQADRLRERHGELTRENTALRHALEEVREHPTRADVHMANCPLIYDDPK